MGRASELAKPSDRQEVVVVAAELEEPEPELEQEPEQVQVRGQVQEQAQEQVQEQAQEQVQEQVQVQEEQEQGPFHRPASARDWWAQRIQWRILELGSERDL